MIYWAPTHNRIWQKVFDFAGSARSVKLTSDGGYVIAGFNLNVDVNDRIVSHGGCDFWIAKLDVAGEVEWQNLYGGSENDMAYSVFQAPDGGYAVAGYSNSYDDDVTGHHGPVGNNNYSDYWVLRLNSIGNIFWEKSLGGYSIEGAGYVPLLDLLNHRSLCSIIQTLDNGFVLAGETYSNDGDVTYNHGNGDCWIVKLSGECPFPATPGVISVQGGRGKVCPGDTKNYFTKYTGGGSYQWTVPAGVILNSGQGTNSIYVTYTGSFSSSGVISVSKVNTCGISTPRTITINRNNPPVPSSITGSTFGLCGLQNVVYSVTAVSGVIYNWTIPGVATIVSGQGPHSIKVNFLPGSFQKTISVTATNGCGTSNARSLIIRSAPETPGTIIGNTTVCSNSINNIYSIAPISSASSYTWIGPSGSHITANGITSAGNTLTTTSANVSIAYGLVTSTSQLKVRANNTCGGGGVRTLNLANCAPRMGEQSAGQEYTIYPNPFKDYITIELPVNTINHYSVSIFDITGREISRTILNNEEGLSNHKIETDKLLPGVYMLTISSGNERQTIRIVKLGIINNQN